MSQPTRERRGAHRPSGLGVAGAVPWLVAAVAIVAVVGWATGWWGGGDPRPSSTNTVTAGPSATTATTSGSTPTKATSGTSPTSSAPSSPPATADRTQSVSVLNSTGRSGLAAGAAARLREAGWTIRSTGNANGGGATSVYYGRASLRPTAQAVAADLGAPAVLRESADFGAGRITVVLGSDYPG